MYNGCLISLKLTQMYVTVSSHNYFSFSLRLKIIVGLLILFNIRASNINTVNPRSIITLQYKKCSLYKHSDTLLTPRAFDMPRHRHKCQLTNANFCNFFSNRTKFWLRGIKCFEKWRVYLLSYLWKTRPETHYFERSKFDPSRVTCNWMTMTDYMVDVDTHVAQHPIAMTPYWIAQSQRFKLNQDIYIWMSISFILKVNSFPYI